MPESVDVLLERLANLVRAEERRMGQETGLQPVQLHVLQYLDRANRYSDTPAAVTEYLGLTKGTVSQTLITLEKRGLLERNADKKDRRVVRLALTADGRTFVRRCSPPPVMAKALRAMPEEDNRRLSLELTNLLQDLQEAAGVRGFGVCKTCRHFLTQAGGFRCGLTSEALPVKQTAKICREHQAQPESD